MSVRTGAQGRAVLRIGAEAVALAPGSEIDIVQLDASGTQLALRHGRIGVRLSRLDPARSIEVDMPRGGVWLLTPGEYDITAGDERAAGRLAVLDGRARFVGKGADSAVEAGSTAVLSGKDPVTAAIDTAAPDTIAEWWRSAVAEPADPPALQYVAAAMTGYDALDEHGTWRDHRRHRPGLDAEHRARRLGALSTRQLAPHRAVGLDLDRRHAVGVRAVALRPLDPGPRPRRRRARSLGLGPRQDRRGPRLHAGRRRLYRHRRGRAQLSGRVQPGGGVVPAGARRNLLAGLYRRPRRDPPASMSPRSTTRRRSITATNGDPSAEIVHGDYLYRSYASVVPRSVFVGGRPVAPALVSLPQRRLANAPLLTGSPGIAPATSRVATSRVMTVAAAAGRGGAKLAKAVQTLARILKPGEAQAAARSEAPAARSAVLTRSDRKRGPACPFRSQPPGAGRARRREESASWQRPPAGAEPPSS